VTGVQRCALQISRRERFELSNPIIVTRWQRLAVV